MVKLKVDEEWSGVEGRLQWVWSREVGVTYISIF